MQLIRCIRWTDVFVLQGAPILGLAFSIHSVTAAKLTIAIVFGVASLLLAIHVFTLNDWAEIAQRTQGEGESEPDADGKPVPPNRLLILSLSSLAVSLLLTAALSWRLFLLSLAVTLLGLLYSHPWLNGKTKPVLSTVLHLVGGCLYFLLGYVLFWSLDFRGLVIGLFFGLTFAAGHPIQEVRDFSGDQQLGAKTNAVVFGARSVFFAGMALFSAQYLYLFVLAWSGLIPRVLAVLPVLFLPLHLLLAWTTYRRGLTREDVQQFENRYRILYAVIGLTMFAAVFGR